MAVLWEPEDVATGMWIARQVAIVHSPWVCALERAGLVILHRSSGRRAERVLRLPSQSGVLLGSVFPELPLEGRGEVEQQTTERLLASRGQTLMDEHWGRYVAFLCDAAERALYVVRDPSGQLPCYFWRAGAVRLFFAELSDALPFAPDGLTLNPSALKTFLLNETQRLRQTGFREITEVLAGECLCVGPVEIRRQVLWEPARVCERGWLVEPVSAAALLREITEACVATWASQDDSVLLNLSGGFDSAVVLGSWARTPTEHRPRLTAVNRYLANFEEDERAFARAAARAAGVDLVEWAWDAEGTSLDRVVDELPAMPRPSVQSLGLIDLEARGALAARRGATSTWTGQGGDHLFYHMESELFATDYLQRCGWSSEVFARAKQAARLTRKSYWSVLWSLLNTYLNFDAVHELLESVEWHPWTLSAAGLPPGKRLQVEVLVDLVHRPAPLAGLEAAPECHPLISQPLIETCLSIPSDVLLQDGQLRGLARAAFREHVPEQILGRDAKGTTQSYLVRIVRENGRRVRELLLEGRLAREGFLDRARLERHLLQEEPLKPTQLLPLLACLTAEIWLQRMADVRWGPRATSLG